MRIKFGSFGRPRDDNLYERDGKRWRCCLCCHVRTGTILLGVWHLALHMLSLAAIAVLVLHPQVTNQRPDIRNGGSYVNSDQDLLSILPTPLSAENHEEPQALPVSELTSGSERMNKQNGDNSAKLLYGSFVYKDWFGERPPPDQRVTYQDLNISIGVNFCTLGITLLMIYGAVRGKSLYLMPFFCLQAFDFFVTSLSVIGYLSYIPDIRQVLIKVPNIPLRDELLAMDQQCLSLLILAAILLTLVGKMYFISIVWSCYKFLTIRAEAALERENCGSGIIDGQNLLEMPSGLSAMGSDLPDYATAMTDPRFAKKPMYPVPPPPYAAVVDMVVTESETADTTRVVANGANGANGANDANAQDSPKP